MFMCALAQNNALDPITMRPVYDDDLDVDLPRKDHTQGKMVVSIFDRDFSEVSTLHLRILSLMQLGRFSSNVLRSQGLLSLINMATIEHGEDAVNRALESQFLPPVGKLQSYSIGPDLLEERLRRLVRFLRDRGVDVEIDQIESD